MSDGPFGHKAVFLGRGSGYSVQFPRLRVFGMGLSSRSRSVRRCHRRSADGTLFRGRVEDWRASFRVRWLFRRFRVGPQSGSHDCVSSPPLIKPDVRISRIRLSDEIMPSHSEGPWSFASGARGCIRHAASRPGSAQSSRPSPCAFDRATGVAAYQLPRQFPKPAPHAIRLNVRKALSVRPGSAVVATDPPPGFGEKVLAPHLVDRRVETPVGFFLSFRAARPIKVRFRVDLDETGTAGRDGGRA